MHSETNGTILLYCAAMKLRIHTSGEEYVLYGSYHYIGIYAYSNGFRDCVVMQSIDEHW